MYEKYTAAAVQMGAKNAAAFRISDIFFDSRVILKCVFGCETYGKNHTCPNQRSKLTMNEYREIFSRYSGGVVIGTNDKALSQHISYEVERRAFLDGFYFAFSLSDCGLCKDCGITSDIPCRFPGKARPAFHSVGIDVFKTVHGLGLPLSVAHSKFDELNWYSAVFID